MFHILYMRFLINRKIALLYITWRSISLYKSRIHVIIIVLCFVFALVFSSSLSLQFLLPLPSLLRPLPSLLLPSQISTWNGKVRRLASFNRNCKLSMHIKNDIRKRLLISINRSGLSDFPISSKNTRKQRQRRERPQQRRQRWQRL